MAQQPAQGYNGSGTLDWKALPVSIKPVHMITERQNYCMHAHLSFIIHKTHEKLGSSEFVVLKKWVDIRIRFEDHELVHSMSFDTNR